MKRTFFKLMAAVLLVAGVYAAQAQNPCITTDKLNINTGIDANDVPMAYSSKGTPDPFWTISGQSGAAPSGVIIGSPAIITTNNVMATDPATGLISYASDGGSTGYLTTPHSTAFGAFSLTYQRTFRTCADDQISFYFDLAFDNYLVDIRIDGNPIPGATTAPTTSAPGFYQWGNIYTSVQNLSAGTHTIDVTIGNEDASFSGNPTSLNIRGSISGTTNSIVANNSDPKCNCNSISSCDDKCYWKVAGNNILNGNNIFGTLTKDDIRIQSSAIDRGIITQAGSLGWNTMSPTARLHVNVTSMTPTTGIRFEGLPQAQDKDVLTVDDAGNVHRMPYSGGGANACGTVNYLPRTSSGSGTMTCSQVYDNGTSVGINTTGSFGYTAGTGVFTAGSPGSQNVKLDVNGLTRSVTIVATSDARYKTNVTTLTNALDKVNRLRGVSYNWKKTEFPAKGFDENVHLGFLAQELLDVLPETVIKDENGDYAVEYNAIIPVLAQAIREQQQEIEQLKSALQGGKHVTADATVADAGSLAQNVPNPFSVSTVISYTLPKNTQKAAIGVYDMNGKELKLFPLPAERNGAVTIQGGDLKPGMYLYTLIVDGKYFDSKKMVLTSQ